LHDGIDACFGSANFATDLIPLRQSAAKAPSIVLSYQANAADTNGQSTRWLASGLMMPLFYVSEYCDEASLVCGSRTLVRPTHSLEAIPAGLLILIAEARQRGARDDHILVDATTACSHGADHDAILSDWKTAAEDHDFSVIGRIEAETRLPALCDPGQILGGDVKSPGSPRFVDRDIHAPEPRAVHSNMRNETAPRIYYSDVIRKAHLERFSFTCRNDAPRVG
jgi:hypothetical protein